METLIYTLQSLDPWVVYAVLFGIAFVENVFPPSPSDLVVVFGGSLVGIGRVGFVESVVAATLGSGLGFLAMYKVGDWFGTKILEQRRIKFIPIEGVRKVDAWFRQYGYWIIVANRFLAGTRAVVSFFAGMAKLSLLPTLALSLVSALAWNSILVGGGYLLGQNWERIGLYLTTYSQIVTALVVAALIVFLIRYIYRKNSRKRTS